MSEIGMDRVMKILALVIIISLAFPAAAYSVNEGGDGSEAGSQQECSTSCDLTISELDDSLLASKEVKWEEKGWYFISLPRLPSAFTASIKNELCAPSDLFSNKGSCDLVYFYNANEESWMKWNGSVSEEENELNNIKGGRGYWVHVNETGYSEPIEWNDFQDNPIEEPTWRKVTEGWYPRGWTAPHYDADYSEYNPMNISDAIPSVNRNWSLNISNVWRKEGYGTNVTSLEPYWPEDENAVFTNDENTDMLNHGYWTCNNTESELPAGYCSGSKPPRMPWQTDYFNVSSVTSNDIEKGEDLEVNATIENTAEEEATQNIRLVIPELDLRRIEENVTVGAGQTKEVTISTSTGEVEPGDYTAVVYTGNNETKHRGEDTFTITGSYFDVDIIDTNSPVDEGKTLEVNATVTNTGDQSGTQDINLDAGGVTRDTTTETIDPGAERDVTLEWNTAEGDAGDYTAEVSSDDDTDSIDVTVLGEPYFDVSIDSTNSPVEEGETLTVDTTITNTGDQSDTQDIGLNINSSTKDSESLSLAASDSQAITLEWNTGTGDAGTYTAEVSSDDDSDSTAVEVEEEPVEEYSLDVTVEGEGSVDIDPDQTTYEHGTEVTLTADPEDGWEFVEWTGDYESTEEEITITMDGDKEITAKFEEQEEEEEAVPAADIALLLLGLSLAVMIYHVKKR